MTPESLLRQFDVVADAPDGVRKLRELILQLAVRGKLVPQDPGDEPASVLLERARAVQESLISTGEISRPKGSANLDAADAPHVLPDSWCWVRLGEIVAILDSRRVPVKENEREARIAGKPMAALVPYYGATQQVGWIDDALFEEELVLLGEDGAPFFREGKHVAYVIRGRSWVNNHAHALRGLASTSNPYLCNALNVADYHGFVTGTTRHKLTQGKMVDLPIPLPPLAEQHRIVAKVDELMALCDELEARQQRRAEARARLNRSALHHLTAASDDAELAAHWERLRENFHLIYDTPESVVELRQAVLQLAVRGQLVPQDPSDEPASVLLERIAVEKERLIAEGKIRQARKIPAINEGEVPFGVPEGWAWARLGSLADPLRSLSYGVLVPGPDVDSGVPFVRIQDVSGRAPPPHPRKSIHPTIEARYARTRLQGGEILIGVVGSIGTIGVAPAQWAGANIARALCRFAPAADLDRDYLALVLRCPMVQQYFTIATRTLAQPTLNVGQIEVTNVPLPPLAEQRRIVAKVDGLMALCDALEARLTRARESSARLAASVVHHLTAA